MSNGIEPTNLVSPTSLMGGNIDGDGSRTDPKSIERERANGINRLPAEVLSHIFILGNEDGSENEDGREDDAEDESDSDSDSSSTSPTLVHFATLCSHVCKYWRNVAIETPQLWAFIDFTEGYPFHRSEEWIARSKAVPLTFDIDHVADFDDDEATELELIDLSVRVENEVNRIYFMIVPHAHRWLALEIAADRYEFIWSWLVLLGSCPATPALEYLGLFCHEDTHDEDFFLPAEFRGPRSILPNTLKLNRVDLWGVNIDWEAAKFLQDLKTLHFAYHSKDVRPSVEQFVSMLNRSPHIEDLALEGSAPLLGDWPYQRIALNSLRDLALVGVEVAIAVKVVEHLEFPALKNLILDFDQDPSTAVFISSVCKGDLPRFRGVDALKLTSFPCTQQEGFRFLKSMPKLSSMTLNFTYLPSHFYHALVHKSVCPEVHTLKLSGLGETELRFIIIRRRYNGVTPIQRLYLDQDDPIGDDTIGWLKKNVEQFEFYEPSDEEDDDEESEGDEEEGDEEEDEDEVHNHEDG